MKKQLCDRATMKKSRLLVYLFSLFLIGCIEPKNSASFSVFYNNGEELPIPFLEENDSLTSPYGFIVRRVEEPDEKFYKADELNRKSYDQMVQQHGKNWLKEFEKETCQTIYLDWKQNSFVLEACDPMTIEGAWRLFVTALDQNNDDRLKKYSLPKILCPECMYRTEAYQNRKTAKDLENAYKNQRFPIEQFWEKEAPIEFPGKLIGILKKEEIKISSVLEHNLEYFFNDSTINPKDAFLISVVTTKPGVIGLEHEGGSHVFSFLRTADGFKFGGLITVP